MKELQRCLSERLSTLRDSRKGSVFFIEHGLNANDLEDLRALVRSNLKHNPIGSSWWDDRDLPLLVVSTEIGYRYRGSGTDFWPLLECEMEVEFLPMDRQRLKDRFVRASQQFRGVCPPTTPWTESFHLIAWPIAHSLLPLEFHRPLAVTLANLQKSIGSADDNTLYQAVRSAASYPSARFSSLLADAGLIVSLTRNLLEHDCGDFSAEIISRISADLNADSVARRSMTVARGIQQQKRIAGRSKPPPAVRNKGKLQLRRTPNKTFLLEAIFPQLEPDISARLRRALRRRRFAPQLWGVTARVPSDQLLSGLPFPLKFVTLPETDAQLFPDLIEAEFDAQDIAVLYTFELQLAPPHIFAVNADEPIGSLVRGSTISAHKKYWMLLRQGDNVPQGMRILGEVGPMRCVELDPTNPDDARALMQLGYDIRRTVSVRFAGAPSIDREPDIPTFVAGDYRVIVHEHQDGEAALVVNLGGHTAVASSSETVGFRVETGDHRVRVSNETGAREYAFRVIGIAPSRKSSVYLELRSEELTVQALLGGRLSFMVDGTAPMDGLEMTVDLEFDGHLFSASGALGLIPQPVSTEHAVMKLLLSESVRELVSRATSVTLRARVGNLARAAWVLEQLVRPSWWEPREDPKLLSENGPLRFGVIRADDPVCSPVEGVTGIGTYLLAPVGLNTIEVNGASPFTTLCLAPNRVQLSALSITKPRLERRRRGSRLGIGFEDLTEAYLRWSLAETRNTIGEIQRRYVTTRLEEWMTEICCGQEWALAENSLPSRDTWGLLADVCHKLDLGCDAYLGLSKEIDAQVRALAVNEIRRSMPALWARVGTPSDLHDDDYEAIDQAFATAYQELAKRHRIRGRTQLAGELEAADPGESPDKWEMALALVREQIELRALAAMLLPSDSAARLMRLDLGGMTVDEVADELVAWARVARKAFAGAIPSREALRASYALWIEPTLALTMDWRGALDTLLAERTVARATRFLAVKARMARVGTL